MVQVVSVHDDARLYDQAEVRAIVAQEGAAVGFTPGKPTDIIRRTFRGAGFRAIVPRDNLYNYKVRPGRDVLETLRVVIDRDPDVSKAMTNFLLLMGRGYTKTVRNIGPDGTLGAVNVPADAYITQLDQRVGQEYGGGMDAVINVLNKSLIWQGAQALEIELSDDLTTVTDVHPVSPHMIAFKRDETTGRLMRGVMGTPADTPGRDNDGFTELNPLQFWYVPFHPNVQEPYGAPPLLAALTAVFFKVELLTDLQAVIHNQGHPRLDISVAFASIADRIPKTMLAKGKQDELRAFVRGFLEDVALGFSKLEVDDSHVHADNVKVGYVGPPGTIDFKSLSEILDNQIIAGVKQLPILLGRNEGATTTHATVQWGMFAEQIDAFQRITKRTIERTHNTALAIAGYACASEVEFAGQPTADRLAEAQARGAEIANELALVDNGIIDRDEAANTLVEHDATGTVAAPPAPTTGTAPATGNTDTTTTGGTNNGTNTIEQSGTRQLREHERPPARPALGREASGLAGQRRGFRAGDRREGDAYCQYRGHDRADEHRPGIRDQGRDPDTGREGGRELVAILARDRTNLVRRDTPVNYTGEDVGFLGWFKSLFAGLFGEGDPTTDPLDDDPDRGAVPTIRDTTTDEATTLAEVYTARLDAANGDIDTLAADVQAEVSARFAALAEAFPSAQVASGATTPAEWFATDAGTTWTGQFRTVLTDHYRKTWDVRGQGVLEELGIDAVFQLENPDALAALDEIGLERVSGMNDVTHDQVLDILRAGVDNGDHPDVIASAIRAALDGMTVGRSNTIARTETAFAYSYSAIESYRRNGVTRKLWLNAGDSKVDAPCNDFADNGSIPIDEDFGDGIGYPPAHPNCRCALIADLTDAEDVPPWTGA